MEGKNIYWLIADSIKRTESNYKNGQLHGKSYTWNNDGTLVTRIKL